MPARMNPATWMVDVISGNGESVDMVPEFPEQFPTAKPGVTRGPSRRFQRTPQLREGTDLAVLYAESPAAVTLQQEIDYTLAVGRRLISADFRCRIGSFATVHCPVVAFPGKRRFFVGVDSILGRKAVSGVAAPLLGIAVA